MRIEGFLRVISYGLGLQWQIRKRYPRIFILDVENTQIQVPSLVGTLHMQTHPAF
jgi:hypothetical protein